MPERKRERGWERGGGSGRENRNVTLEPYSSSTLVIQYGASLSQMSAISNFTHSKLTTVWIFNGSSPLSSFYTWRPPVCLSSTSLRYIVTRRSFCVLATPCSERSRGHKEEVRVYLVYSSLGDSALLLMLLIRLLYMFTHTPMRMIMSPHM